MDVRALQTRLASAGCACTADGVIGPMTYAAMLSYAAQRQLGQLGQALGVAMATQFPAYGIKSDLNIIHWIAQTCHETESYHYFTELGGPTYFQRYDGRADLGNTEPGDGYRYRGRGLLQLTGRDNYRRIGAEINEPLEDNPELAGQPGISVTIGCLFWRDHGIEPLADADDILAVTRKVNGGENGLQDRQSITLRLKRLCGLTA